jgi:cellulose synthase/poly-beta-1,6-N-acetylglucosamine synthase-like glycosyltransferase
MLFIFLFSMAQLQLALIYKKRRQKNPSEPKPEIWIGDDKPFVTIQLPVYNERYVVGRLLDVVARMKWPKDKFEIQVLDDSTDVTSEIIVSRVKDMINQGIQVHHIRRDVRTGYKAGALQYGMKSARGAFIAIFDADFLPQPHFLEQTMAYF